MQRKQKQLHSYQLSYMRNWKKEKVEKNLKTCCNETKSDLINQGAKIQKDKLPCKIVRSHFMQIR